MSVNPIKVGAWAMIGGTVATAGTFYYAHTEAKKRNSNWPYVVATVISPVPMFYGALAGGIIKGMPAGQAARHMVGISLKTIKFVDTHGATAALELSKAPFRFAEWLLTP